MTDKNNSTKGLERLPELMANIRAEFAINHAAIALLTADLAEAAKTLRRYEVFHRAKGTEESNQKADVNAALAKRFETTIQRVNHEG